MAFWQTSLEENLPCQLVPFATILNRRVDRSTQIGANLAKASASPKKSGKPSLTGAASRLNLSPKQRNDAAIALPDRQGTSTLDLFRFAPFRLNRLAAEVSAALSAEYREPYGLDIPEWRVLATLGFRNDACSAQYIAHCTRTHKSTISRAVLALTKRQLVERVENEDDRREFRLRMTRKGRALHQKLIPRLLRKEQEILSCLSAQERKDFAQVLGKIENSLGLVQTIKEANAKEAY
jgi:DNA-binding MarR family transcriptional regulator